MNPVWLFCVWLAPVLWVIFLVRALAYRRFLSMPVWICYSLMALPFDVAWASTFFQYTVWHMIIGFIGRAAITMEAIYHVLKAVEKEHGKHAAAMSGLWAGAAGILAILSRHDSRSKIAWVVTSVRVGCSAALVITVGACLLNRVKHVPFCFWHAGLMMMLLASAAIASAFSPHYGAAARGDGWDLFSYVVKDAVLMAWIWLVGPKMFTLRLDRRRTVPQSRAAAC